MTAAIIDLHPPEVFVGEPDLDAYPSLLEDLLPAYDHRQHFSACIPGSRAEVFRVLKQLRFSDLRVLRTLMAVRTLGKTESADTEEPIFTGAALAEYVRYEERPDREIVLAMMGHLWTMNAFVPIPNRQTFIDVTDPTYVRTACSLTLEEELDGTRLHIETRVKDPWDLASARRFHLYWYLMGQIGAATFALDILSAAKRQVRATAPSSGEPCCSPLRVNDRTMGTALALGAVALGVVIALRRRYLGRR